MTLLTVPSRPLPAKLLVANRGEIAVRIIRSCRDMGIGSVAMFSPTDRDSLHAELADEAFATHESGYLDAEEVLRIAHHSGAEAIHPGYGFLAENADFAEQVITSGLIWVGPSPEAIAALGDKVQARALAQQVGAPLVAGTSTPVSGVDEVIDFAAKHGFPIAVKAAHGGGGRGIKVIENGDEVASSYHSAVREAEAAFGRGECFVEAFLSTPRHVETQCLADEHGRVIVVSTRDCSLQRRNQKLVEEAPAPTISTDQSRLLTDASIAILEAVGYTGAGTCEFLIDGDRVTFLEVNTRIQVEHPVTEEITGTDLISSMILIACGAGLTEAPPVRGHSIEFRINAEDVTTDFSPAPGTITRLEWPTGPGVRVDTGYRSGDTIPSSYDSLIAKLIVTAPTRHAVLTRAARALRETVIEGLPTTLDFHRWVLEEAAFASGDGGEIYTRWIDGNFSPQNDSAALAPPIDRAAMERIVAEVDGRRVVLLLPRVPQTSSGSPTESASSCDETDRAPGIDDRSAVRTPMAGSVVSVAAHDGMTVESGDILIVIEAMKMERPIRATRTGTVRDLMVRSGQHLAQGEMICGVAPH